VSVELLDRAEVRRTRSPRRCCRPGHVPMDAVAEATIGVTHAVHALYVTERDEPPVAAMALVRRGVDTDVITPASFAARSARLDDVHVVVLDDVAHARLPIARWRRSRRGSSAAAR
jgi:hypothetical protein